MSTQEPGEVHRQHGWVWLFAIVFEAVLVAAFLAEYKEGWFLVELYNFALATHYPFFIFAQILDSNVAGLFILLFYELAMVLLWVFLFKWLWKLLQRQLARRGISRAQKLMAIAGLVVLAIVVSSWEIVDSHFDRPTPFKPSPDVKAIVGGNNAFALDLYQQLKGQPGNLFFSPHSISTGMGMVYAGARGATERELASTLHFNLPQTDLDPAFAQLAARLKSLQHWHHLSLLPANSLWYQRDHSFTPAFMNLVHTHYQGEERPVDFRQAAAAAGQEMASWIERRTGGRLKGAVSPDLLTPETRLALCDTIYFKGQWASPFKRSHTQPGPFSITTNQTVTVPMMRQKAEFKLARVDCGDNLSVELLELPYYGRDLSMIVLLPRQVDELHELERQLNAASLQEWLAELDKGSPHTTHISIPRFTITRNIDLKKELSSMGVTTLCDARADLSGMDGSTNLYISDLLHQAFVEVNEHGTEAAAMTLALAKTKGMDDRFLADHPFIFLIRDNASGSILFLGRMVDPSRP